MIISRKALTNLINSVRKMDTMESREALQQYDSDRKKDEEKIRKQRKAISEVIE